MRLNMFFAEVLQIHPALLNLQKLNVQKKVAVTSTLALFIVGLTACAGSELESNQRAPRGVTTPTVTATPATRPTTSNPTTPNPTTAPSAPPTITPSPVPPNNGKLRVFILAGDSAMMGFGKVDLGIGADEQVIGGAGSLRALINTNANQYADLLNPNQLITYPSFTGTTTYASWASRNDVWVSFWNDESIKDRTPTGATYEKRNGALTVGFGARLSLPTGLIGPEYGFGRTIGNGLQDKVLLIKVAWRDKSLAIDFRPPSSVVSDGGVIGANYRELVTSVDKVLINIRQYYPEYNNQGYELTGFAWHQGFADRANENFSNEYEANLVHLIDDLRVEFEAPDMLAVIGNAGMDNADQNPLAANILIAQQNVADPLKYPQFAGSISVVNTRPFDYSTVFPEAQFGSQWNFNGESYFRIGERMGEEMLRLMLGNR